MTEESIHVQVDINDTNAQHHQVPDFPIAVFTFGIQVLVVAAAMLYSVGISIAALGVLMMAAACLGRSRYLDRSRWLLLSARSCFTKTASQGCARGGYRIAARQMITVSPATLGVNGTAKLLPSSSVSMKNRKRSSIKSRAGASVKAQNWGGRSPPPLNR